MPTWQEPVTRLAYRSAALFNLIIHGSRRAKSFEKRRLGHAEFVVP